MKFLLMIASVSFVVGCAGLQTVSDYDKNASEVVTVTYEGKQFKVQDNVVKSAALLQEDAATDIAKAMVEGALFMLVDLTAAVGSFEGAMNVYLKQYKDSDCKIDRSNFISDGMGGGIGYEIFYSCEPAKA